MMRNPSTSQVVWLPKQKLLMKTINVKQESRPAQLSPLRVVLNPKKKRAVLSGQWLQPEIKIEEDNDSSHPDSFSTVRVKKEDKDYELTCSLRDISSMQAHQQEVLLEVKEEKESFDPTSCVTVKEEHEDYDDSFNRYSHTMLPSCQAFVPSRERKGPRIWIMGDNQVCCAEKQAKEMIGANLGLNAHVSWFGWGDMCWADLVPYFKLCLQQRPVPDVLLIHCGGNNLGHMKSVELLSIMKWDLILLHKQFPQMKLVVSAITRRCLWGSAQLGKIVKARKFVNKVMSTFVLSIGSFLPHPCIVFDIPGLFLDDGVNFTPTGNYIFLNDIVYCLKAQIQ